MITPVWLWMFTNVVTLDSFKQRGVLVLTQSKAALVQDFQTLLIALKLLLYGISGVSVVLSPHSIEASVIVLKHKQLFFQITSFNRTAYVS